MAEQEAEDASSGEYVLEVPIYLGKLLKNNHLADRIQPEEPFFQVAIKQQVGLRQRLGEGHFLSLQHE